MCSGYKYLETPNVMSGVASGGAQENRQLRKKSQNEHVRCPLLHLSLHVQGKRYVMGLLSGATVIAQLDQWVSVRNLERPLVPCENVTRVRMVTFPVESVLEILPRSFRRS